MVFKSAVDRWFYLLIGLTVILVLLAVLPAFAQAGVQEAALLVFVVVLALGLPIWLLVATSYQIESGRLTIRSGPFRWTVLLRDIESIEPSRSMLSGPALSLDRLEIRYQQGRKVLVSPENREKFLHAIEVRAKQL